MQQLSKISQLHTLLINVTVRLGRLQFIDVLKPLGKTRYHNIWHITFLAGLYTSGLICGWAYPRDEKKVNRTVGLYVRMFHQTTKNIISNQVYLTRSTVYLSDDDDDVLSLERLLYSHLSESLSHSRRTPVSGFYSFPADTDVFKTSSGHLKKVTTSYDQTRRRHDVWKKTQDLRRLEDV